MSTSLLGWVGYSYLKLHDTLGKPLHFVSRPLSGVTPSRMTFGSDLLR